MPAPVVLILAAGRGERFLASGGNTHKCIGWRQSPEVAPYRWPFEENGRTFDLAIEPQITTKEGANKQVISSQADSLIKISRIWADFFPANTSNQPI